MKQISGLLVVVLVGCASTSGVHQLSPEDFTLTANASPGAGGIETTRANALDQAQASCAARGKHSKVAREVTTAPTWTDGMAHTTIDFICINWQPIGK